MPPKKIFVDEPKEEPLEIKVEEPPVKVKKPRKKRAPLSDEQKQKLVERLKLAREAKKKTQEKKKPKAVVVIDKKETKAKKKLVEPPSPSDNGIYKKQQDELSLLRHQLEINKLKNDLELQTESHRKIKPNNSPPSTAETSNIKEPIIQVEVTSPIDNIPPIMPKKVRKNIAGGVNIWDRIRNSN